MPLKPQFLRLFVPVVLASALLVGCATNPALEVPEVTEASSTTQPTPTKTPSRKPSPTFPKFCEDVATRAKVQQTLRRYLHGDIHRVYTNDLTKSGRKARVTCSYGTKRTSRPQPKPLPPLVTISVSQYTSSKAASQQVKSTVSAGKRRGSTWTQKVNNHQGYVLNDSKDISLVLAKGSMTYVVTVLHGTVAKHAEKVVLLQLAQDVVPSK